jgi:hypothetical protein
VTGRSFRLVVPAAMIAAAVFSEIEVKGREGRGFGDWR